MSVEMRPIPGFPSYQITTEGRVLGSGRWGNPAWLAPGIDSSGYPMLILYRDGKRYARKVHALVMLAFVGPRPEGMEVCHKDGNRTNCDINNLRYGTRIENRADRIVHGTHDRGERNTSAKLRESDVHEIRSIYAAGGISQVELGRRYGVDSKLIHEIVHRRHWAWLASDGECDPPEEQE